MLKTVHSVVLPDGIVSNPKSQFEYVHFGRCCNRRICMSIFSILRPSGIFYVNLVYFKIWQPCMQPVRDMCACFCVCTRTSENLKTVFKKWFFSTERNRSRTFFAIFFCFGNKTFSSVICQLSIGNLHPLFCRNHARAHCYYFLTHSIILSRNGYTCTYIQWNLAM
jgi:hypothetical protein